MPNSPHSTPPVAIAATASPLRPFDPQFEARWSAWQARGAAHNAVIQGRLRFVAPFLGVLTAAAAYLLNR
jgi:hypothetical protein